MRKQLLTILALAAAAGCSKQPYFSDDEGGPRNNGGDSDELSSPYALGTQVRIAIRGPNEDMSTWKLESDTPSVLTVDKLTVDNDKHVTADCTALAEGTANLRMLDSGGKEVRHAAVEVRAPDSAKLLAHAQLRILGREATSADSAEVKEVRVATGGTGVFAVAYYRGSTRVYGRNIAETPAIAQVTVEDHTTNGVFVNEWLFVKPAADGAAMLTVQHRGNTLATFPLVAVPPTDVTDVALSEEARGDKKDGDDVWLWARTRDAMGRDVYGLYCAWTLDGAPQVGKDNDTKKTSGDLYRYQLASDGAARKAAATCAAKSASLDVRAKGGYVADTTYLGCSLAPGGRARGAGAFLFALALVGLALVRRRR